MRRYIGGSLFLFLILALTPSAGQAQAWNATGYSPPDTTLPLPLYSTRPEKGGLFVNLSFVMYRQTNPLESQPVAVRGLQDTDGSLTNTPGRLFGPLTPALDVHQVTGPKSYQPGTRAGLGYRFQDGSALELSWIHLAKTSYTAVATLVPADLSFNNDLTSTFLFSPVNSFPIGFAGPAFDTGVGNLNSSFGIWNAADNMEIEFVQRNEFVDLLYRRDVHECENSRTYGYMGVGFAWFWERFRWRTVDRDANGNALPTDVGIYSNIISNRLYGAKIGAGHEHYLGHGFAVSFDVYAGLYLDVVKKRVKYERGDRNAGPERKRSRTDYKLAPGFQGNVFLWWYPAEGIQVRLGYDVMAFLNTVASPQPIDFNYSSVNPIYDDVFRILDGLQFGVSLSF